MCVTCLTGETFHSSLFLQAVLPLSALLSARLSCCAAILGSSCSSSS